MKKLLRLGVYCFFLQPGFVVAQTHSQGEIPHTLVQALKPAVVNVKTAIPIAVDGDEPGSWEGTGFIADAKQGLIVTNRHVSSRNSLAQYKITFSNGESVNANEVGLIHVDPWHDVAILKIDPALLKFPLQAVEFGDSRALKTQDKVFLIGNNEGQNYTVLYGEVINTAVNPHIEGNLNRHSGSFQVVFGNRGGSSGSPIFNSRGKVVGLHYSGTDVTGNELRIEYVTDALHCLAAGATSACRGDIGVELDLIKLSDAKKHLHMPDTVIKQVLSSPEFKDSQDIAFVAKSIPESPAVGKLEPGDIVVKVDETLVGDSLYKFDKTVDGKVGKNIVVDVIRNGKAFSVTLPVENADTQKVISVVTFAGGVFHNITPELRRRFNIASDGVFMNEAEQGSSMDIGGRAEKRTNQRLVVIQAVNGKPTPNLPAFINEIRQFKNGDNIYLTIRDFMAFDNAPQAVPITLDLQYFPARIFNFSKDKLKWEELPETKPIS